MTRIAVCLSGQPRTWKTCLPSLKSFFDDIGQEHIKADYFIHTWTSNWWKNKRVLEANEIDDSVNEIRDAFSAKGFVAENQKENLRSWEGLFHSMAFANQLKREYEIANGFEYDIVVKARLDLAFKPGARFFPVPVNPMIAYSPDTIGTISFEYYQRNFSDVFFYSNSSTMDLLVDGFRWAYSGGISPEIVKRYGPGAIIYQHMVHTGIHPVNTTRIPYVIVRKQAEHFDVKNQYEEIEKIHFDYYK